MSRTRTGPIAVRVALRGDPSSSDSSPTAAGASTTASTASSPEAVHWVTRS